MSYCFGLERPVGNVRLVVHSAEHVVLLEKVEAVRYGGAVLVRLQIGARRVVPHAHVPELAEAIARDEHLFGQLADVDR